MNKSNSLTDSLDRLTPNCQLAVSIRAVERIATLACDAKNSQRAIDIAKRISLVQATRQDDKQSHELWQLLGKRFEDQMRLQGPASSSPESRAIDAWVMASLAIRSLCASSVHEIRNAVSLAEYAFSNAMWAVLGFDESQARIGDFNQAMRYDIDRLTRLKVPSDAFYARPLWPDGAPEGWETAQALVRNKVDGVRAPKSAARRPSGVHPLRVAELRLRNFRAFRDARLELGDFTVLVGRNGSGKSTLLEALDFVRDALADSLTNALERRGGLQGIRHQGSAERLPDVSIAVVLNVRRAQVVYGFRLTAARGHGGFAIAEERIGGPGLDAFERTGKTFESTIESLRPEVDPETLLLPAVAGMRDHWSWVLHALRQTLTYNLSPAYMRAEPMVGSTRWLSRDGSNIGDILKSVQTRHEDMRWIIEHLQQITPGISGVYAGTAGGRRILQFEQRANGSTGKFTAMSVSDGTLRGLGILTALRQQPLPSIVCIDEVEDSLHPAAQAVIVQALAASAPTMQVIATSHSPEALSLPEVTGDRVRIVQWRNGQSEIYRLNQSTLELLCPPETVGRLLRSNALFAEDTPCRGPEDLWALT